MIKRWWYRLFDEWIAEVRRETRARAIDEFRALTWGRSIEAGIGSDVTSLWKYIETQIKSGVLDK